MGAWAPVLIGFFLILCRCTALLMTAPLYSARAVNARIRMGLALAVAWIAFSAAGAPGFADWAQPGPLLLAVAGETLVGLSAGLASRFALDAAAAAGHAAGLSMGIGLAAVIDPVHGADSTALSELMVFLVMGLALAVGLHREAIVWLCRSVMELPPGSVQSWRDLASAVVSEAARAVALSIRLSFPVMAAVLFVNMALGLLGRLMPQLSFLNLGFAVALLAGGFALYVASPSLAEIVVQAARRAFAPA